MPRRAARRAVRACRRGHALGVVPDDVFDAPSTRTASELLGTWGKDFPLLVIAEEQENVVKSFRNLPGVFVVTSAETEVAELIWVSPVLATETAPCSSSRGRGRVMASLDIRQVLLAPVVSEKSYNQIDENRYTFKVQRRAPAPRPPGRRGAVRRPRPAREHGQGPVQAQAARDAEGPQAGLEEGRRADPPRETIEIFGGSPSLMALRKYKPTSPGCCFMTVSTFEEITKTSRRRACSSR